MTEFFQKLSDISMLTFVVSSMISLGMSQKLEDVFAPLKKLKPLLLAIGLNFVLAPLLGIALSLLIPLQPAHAIGLLLLCSAAGAPFLPKLAEIAGGNLAYSVSLMILLMVVSLVFMPLALPFMVPGVNADPISIAKPLMILMLIPLATGFFLARTNKKWEPGLLKFITALSNISFVLLLLLIISLNLKTMAEAFGSFAIGTYALYVVLLVAIGYWLPGVDKSTRSVFALAAGNRNIAAALVTASAGFDDPEITVMLLVGAIVGLVVLLLLAKYMKRNAESSQA